jgi:hypothetical protein
MPTLLRTVSAFWQSRVTPTESLMQMICCMARQNQIKNTRYKEQDPNQLVRVLFFGSYEK